MYITKIDHMVWQKSSQQTQMTSPSVPLTEKTTLRGKETTENATYTTWPADAVLPQYHDITHQKTIQKTIGNTFPPKQIVWHTQILLQFFFI